MSMVWRMLAAGLMLLAFAGCGYKKNDGTQRDNIQPRVFITNYPPSSDSRVAR